MVDNVVDFDAARFARPSKPDQPAKPVREIAQWRRLAVAASLVATLTSGNWIWGKIQNSLDPAYQAGVGAMAGTNVQQTAPETLEAHNSEHSEHSRPERSERPSATRILFTDGFETGDILAWSSDSPRASSDG